MLDQILPIFFIYLFFYRGDHVPTQKNDKMEGCDIYCYILVNKVLGLVTRWIDILYVIHLLWVMQLHYVHFGKLLF